MTRHVLARVVLFPLFAIGLSPLIAIGLPLSSAGAAEPTPPSMKMAVPPGHIPRESEPSPTISKKVGPVVGGDDILITTGDLEYTQPEFFNLALAPDGDLYAATKRTGLGIEVYRSQDGGTTWVYWGAVNDGPGQVRYPDLTIAYGTVNRVLLTYSTGGEIIVAHADPADIFASWTTVTAIPNTFGTMIDPDIITDVEDFPGYYVYVVGRAISAGGGPIVFARSTNQGASFEAAYVVGPNTGGGSTDNRDPVIEYGNNTAIHVGWSEWPFDLSSASVAVRYRRALNYADSGIGSWDPVTNVTETTDARWSGFPLLASSTSSNMLVMAHREGYISGSTPVFDKTVIRVSSDGGVTWGAPDDTTFPFKYIDDIHEVPGSDSWVALGIDVADFQQHLFKASGNPSLTWNSQEQIGDFPYDLNPVGADLVVDPTRGNRAGALMGKIVFPTTEITDAIRFDGEWRNEPGYPVTEPGFPVGWQATGAPIIVDFENDGQLEVVYPSRNGVDWRIEAYRADGTAVPGWPVDTPQLVFNGLVAAGSLVRAGGTPSIFAGTIDGKVLGYDTDGTPLPGFPVSLDHSSDTYVSIASMDGVTPRQLIAVGGPYADRIHFDGSRSPAPFFVIDDLVGSAAIGDVGGDGNVEVVVAEDDFIYVLKPEVFDDFSVFPDLSHELVGETITVPPILVDLDENGDLEILVGTADGDVHAIHHDGTSVTGWPYNTGLPVRGLAAAQTRGLTAPDVAVVSTNDGAGYSEIHLLDEAGVLYTGFPQGIGSYLHTPQGISIDVLVGFSPEIFVGALGFHAFDNFGGLVDGWPRMGPDYETRHPPACGDIDGDGILEMAWVANDLRVFDMGVPVTGAAENRWPMANYDEKNRRCFQCFDDAATPVKEPKIRSALSFRAPTPNPSSGMVFFRYGLPDDSSVRLEIYDARGRRVRTIVSGSEGAGEKNVSFNGRDARGNRLASGQYFARLSVTGPGGESSFTRKFVMMR